MKEERQSYDSGAKILHWLTVALMIVQFAIGWTMPDIRRGMQPERLMNLHLSVGIVIALVILLRLAWRLVRGAPAPVPGLPGWQKRGAEAVHWLLYGLLFAMVFTGWSFASQRGWTITLFGAVPVPPLFPEGSPLGHAIGELHGTLVWALLIAIGLHVAAALAHQFLFRDRVMQRMLPGPRRL